MRMKILVPRGDAAFSIPAEAAYLQVRTLPEKLLGNNPDNDFCVKVPYKDRDNHDQILFIRPLDAPALRSAAEQALKRTDSLDKEIAVFPDGGGSALGTLALTSILEALADYR